jgi:hypothetical protein
LERFSYLAIFECEECENEELVPRQYTFHLGENARCPRCGTLRVTRLRARDKIDPMISGMLNRLKRLAGGTLYHCCFCRVQFYDRRKIAPRTTPQPVRPDAPPPETAPACATDSTQLQDTASSDE